MRSPAATPLQDDRFLLLEALGRGGMGVVYRAFDRAEQRLVALKVVDGARRAGPAHPLSAEFETWSRLVHPNIVRAYELGRSEKGPIPLGAPYLVLEHVPGGPVHRMLRPGRLRATVVEELARQLLSALACVHAAGFLHRDLKPGNVLIRFEGGREPVPKLTDFGLATRTGRSRTPGTFSGSIPYVSPESLLGLPLDGRTDLYGLGILLYHLATGEMPVRQRDPDEIVRWHLSGPPVDPSRIRPRTAPRLARLIRKLAARDPSCRPASAIEAMALLRCEATDRADPLPPPVEGRAERARLRLALDSIRLGASRVFRVCDGSAVTDYLLREIFVWTQVRSVRFFRLSDGAAQARTALVRMILRLLAEKGEAARECVDRYGLDRSLPLTMLGDLPLPASATSPGLPGGERSLCRFLLDCAARRPIVLWVNGRARTEPLVDALTRRIADRLDAATGPKQGRGGLLLVVAP